MGWTTFNDRLALITVFIIVMLWLAQRWINLPNEVIGATILQFGLLCLLTSTFLRGRSYRSCCQGKIYKTIFGLLTRI